MQLIILEGIHNFEISRTLFPQFVNTAQIQRCRYQCDLVSPGLKVLKGTILFTFAVQKCINNKWNHVSVCEDRLLCDGPQVRESVRTSKKKCFWCLTLFMAEADTVLLYSCLSPRPGNCSMHDLCDMVVHVQVQTSVSVTYKSVLCLYFYVCLVMKHPLGSSVTT